MIPGQIEPFVGPFNSKMTIGGYKPIAFKIAIEASVKTNPKKATLEFKRKPEVEESRHSDSESFVGSTFSKGLAWLTNLYDFPRVARARTAEEFLSSTVQRDHRRSQRAQHVL